MRTRKITAWILFAAMLVTMLPSSLVFAAWGENDCPEIITEVFGDTTNDAKDGDGNDILHGTDLDLDGYTYTVDIPTKDNTNDKATITDSTGASVEVWKKADKEVKHYRRSQFLTFAAKSQASDSTKKKFIDESTSTGISEGAVEIAYMDANKNPLKIKDGTKFDMENASSWEEAWIDLTTDVQRTNVNLKTFLDSDSDLKDLRDNTTAIDRTKLTAADLFATGDQISFIMYNVINGEFSGYLRVKVRDNAGMVTVQDYPFVADGQYPEIEITSTTMKNAAGSTVATAHANTFIPSAVFETATDYQDDELKISKRFPFVDNVALTEAVESITYTDGSVTKTPSDIWAMDDITISTVKVTDHEISSEIESVKYTLQHYPDGAVISGNKTPYASGELENFADGNYNIVGTTDKIVIPKDKEGQNILTIVAIDKSGLEKTDRYYFYIDKTAPDANYELVKLEDQVLQLFSNADTVTKWQQGLDMTTSKDVVDAAQLIAGINAEDEDVYQYRLLARDYTIAESDIDLNTVDVDGVPKGYTATAPVSTNLTYGTWLDWSLDSKVAVIDEEFDGLIQVRVQDKAGNWSTVTDDEEESVIADNTDAVLNVRAYELSDITEEEILEEQNAGVNVIEGNQTKWIKDSAVLEVSITDKDLINQIRSSGLLDGVIKVNAALTGSTTDYVTIWGTSDGATRDNAKDKNFKNELTLTSDYFYGTETDKELKFYVQYDGTGIADISISITDKAENLLEYADDFEYNVRLRVDKINPIVTFKGYDETDTAMTDLLKPNTGATVDYELRNMPWGPNSQVLEVKIVDNDETSTQSGLINGVIKVKTDKPLVIKNQNGGSDLTVAAGSEAVISSDYLVENIENLDYTFFAVYEGTGIAKIEVYAEDEAENERDYPSAQATPVEYDALLRVDKINPEIKNAQLVQTDSDVNDGFMLFTVDETNVDVNTRKQMKVTFEITDENTTAEQAGVNIQNEKITGVDLVDVYDKYVETDKTHLYDNEATTYVTNDTNDEAVDPNIDYILLPVEIGEIDGLGGVFTDPASASNEDIEALVNTYIDKYAAATNPVVWQKASWKDGGIVVPDEFQGAIVLRTIDRVGNVDYSEPITFVAESRDALIDFDPQNGYIWSQNNYGWSKRDYDYVEIRVKDDNEDKVDAWLENVFISVTDLEGNDISANDTVKYAYPNIHANDADLEVDPSGYTYVSLAEFNNEAAYGYDVISKDGLVEKIDRDEEGYIHLGYVRVAESAQIKVTIFDKAKHNDVEYTGNKTTGIWTSRIDRVAPVVTAFDLVPIYEGADPEDNNNGFALVIKAEDALSGMAPDITEADYNVYTPENIPGTGVFATDDSYLYKITNDTDVEIERYNSGTFNAGQYEMPGLQYALIPGNGDLEEVAPWNFESDPSAIYDVNGYNGEMGKPYVWHNYVDDKTPMIPDDFDGLIVVRAIDKAGNITVVGYSSILDVEADDDWNNETQYIQVRTDNKWDDGSIVNVQYYGNNNLLFPADMRKDLSNSLNDGEGAIIEIAEEGITNVVITATEEFAAVKTAKAKKDQRNSDWEGNMIIGNATATGYNDWKFQIVDVKIDKTNPEFAFELVDEAGNKITDKAVEGNVTIKLTDIVDPIPNIPDELGYRSHIPSDIAEVEWCAIPEGSDEEVWKDATDWKNGEVGIFDADAFTGTIKIRVTDNAGNTAEKSQRLNVDGVNAIINLSKSHDDIYSLEPVDVFVTVTENAEFSDVAKVTYEVTDEENNVVESDALTLIGGTVSVDREGTTKVKVTAETKAGVKESKEIIVKIDRTAPTFELEVKDSAGSVDGRATNEKVAIEAVDVKDATSGVAKVEWTAVAEGSDEEKWTEITETSGKYSAEFDVVEAFTGTIKVRVTDVAGHKTVKTQKIHIDKKAPLVVISKSNEEDYSKENVNVFVTVTENAEYSDVASVTYTVNGGAEETLALTGGTISVTEEGTTEIVVTAKTKAGVAATATTTVLIDKTAPTFDFDVVDSTGSVADRTTNEDVTIKVSDAKDAVSGVAKVEYAVVPEGSVEENWTAMTDEADYAVAEAFTGTVKVRVTDKAGFETVKSMKINVDKKAPLVVISKSNEEDYSKENVNVFVTVTENAEYSDVASVTYTVNGGAEETLALTGGTISVTEEGTTEIVVTAKTKAGVAATATTTVLIDKTAPTFDFDVVDSTGSVADRTTNEDVTIKVSNAKDAVSGIAKVEYAVVTEGSAEENYEEIKASSGKYEVKHVVAEAFTGTVKVRVTDKAGFETVKSMKIDVDKATPIINISKSYETTCSNGPVEVSVTVSETAEFSDVASVVYTVDGGAEEELPLIGGTISVDKEGKSVVKVTATNKAGVSVSEEITVTIHHNKLSMPVIEGVQPGGWKSADSKVTVSYAGTEPVYYSLNGSDWKEVPADKKITLVKGTNKIMLQARSNTCQCVSEINTYDINYDNGTPIVELDYNSEWTTESATVLVVVNKGACESDVKSVTYDLTKKGGATEKGKHLTTDGGNIVIAEEGEWTVSNITVEMISGIKYTHSENAVVKVDKTAPELKFELKDTENLAELFGMADVNSKYQQKLEATVSDALSGVTTKLEYAVMEKGIYNPTWVEFAAGETPVVIKTAFDGTVLVRATDIAGNSVVATKTVFTEGIKPEISITAPTEWINTDARMNISVVDKGLSSAISTVTAKYYDGTVVEDAKKLSDEDVSKFMVASLTSEGGTIDVKREGITTVVITATDVAGNVSEQTFTVKIDKTAPSYTGVTNGYIYNYDVTMDEVKDTLSGIKSVNIVFTSGSNSTTRDNVQSSYKFSESGKYTVTLVDNAGNVETVTFTIDKSLKYVINVTEVDDMGRVKVEVLDGSMLTFYQKANSETRFTSMNVKHDSVWIERTGVYYINAKDDRGNVSNTLYIIIAPTKDVTIASLKTTPNRDVTVNVADDENVTITKIKEIFNANMNDVVYSGSGATQPNVELFEDGVYVIENN